MDNVDEYYINNVAVNEKGQYRVVGRTLKNLYDKAVILGKIPLLSVILDDTYQVDIEISKSNFSGYMQDKRDKKSFLISRELVADIIDVYETNLMYEIIEEKDFIWNLCMKINKRR